MISRYLLLLLFVLLGSCQESPVQPPPIKVPQQLLADSTAREQGAQLFVRHCRECHGTFSEGRNPRAGRFDPPAPDFLDSAYSQSDPAYLFWRIRQGKMVEPYFSRGSVMPAFGPYFTEQQIWQLVVYLRYRADGNAATNE